MILNEYSGGQIQSIPHSGFLKNVGVDNVVTINGSCVAIQKFPRTSLGGNRKDLDREQDMFLSWVRDKGLEREFFGANSH